MGKSSKKYPDYSGGTVSVNGRTVATSSRDGNSVNTNYNMSDYEKNMFNALEKGMSDSVSNLFEITDPQRQAWNQQLDALKNQGISNIESIYSPMETNLKNDIASRFGNLDNSVFMDKLNNITNKKAAAIANLSNNLALTQNDLYTNELNNRMNTISFLNNLNSALNANILNYTNAAAANSNAGNSYNNSAYNASMSSSSLNPFSKMASNMLNTDSMLATAKMAMMLM